MQKRAILIISSKQKYEEYMGSGCGAVGRAVGSNVRDPWFESSHQLICAMNCIEKTKIKRKRSR